jgi:hypothetical protein
LFQLFGGKGVFAHPVSPPFNGVHRTYTALDTEFWSLSFSDVESPTLTGIWTMILIRPLIAPSMVAVLLTELSAEEGRVGRLRFLWGETYFSRSSLRQCLHKVGFFFLFRSFLRRL